MSSPCRNPDRRMAAPRLPAIVFAMLLAVGSADALAQQNTAPTADSGPKSVSVSGLLPGGGAPPPPDPTGQRFEGNQQAIARGKQLFGQMNCSGCHFNGGGGIGPALMAGHWRYGGRIEQIYASIAQGRPNGMPTWQGILDPTSIWNLAAYVKTLPETAPPLASPAAMPGTPAKP
jgi:cytochrome c oxidase cbb3-type subunit 3